MIEALENEIGDTSAELVQLSEIGGELDQVRESADLCLASVIN